MSTLPENGWGIGWSNATAAQPVATYWPTSVTTNVRSFGLLLETDAVMRYSGVDLRGYGVGPNVVSDSSSSIVVTHSR